MSIRDAIILSAKCVLCGAGYGQCSCWVECMSCRCMYERGTECQRCTPLAKVAPVKKRKAKR